MQKIIISGTSSGLGSELTKKLSKDYYIICFSRKINILKKKFSRNKNVEFYKVDLTNLNNLEKFLMKITKKHPDIAGLINNAALMYKGNIIEMNIDKVYQNYKIQPSPKLSHGSFTMTTCFGSKICFLSEIDHRSEAYFGQKSEEF